MTQIPMNLKASFSDYVTQRKDVTVVRIGNHVPFLFVFYVPLCGLIRSKKQAAEWRRGEMAAEEGLLHDPTQHLTFIRRELVAMVQLLCGDGELLVGFPDHEIRIPPNLNRAFSCLD